MTLEIPTWIIANLDWVGYGFLAYGVWQFGKLRPDGFFWAMIGSIILLAWGIYLGHWGTVSWNIIFALLYYSAYRKGQQISSILDSVMKKDPK